MIFELVNGCQPANKSMSRVERRTRCRNTAQLLRCGDGAIAYVQLPCSVEQGSWGGWGETAIA
ncbi:hypothetical protein [Nostoc sp. MS1]|uniref:hypothetical protein n=1 Tax=Nostoc sp. MS1 TaxID=2764711 RepID=UPI001CC48363|nr:hypothetical protein [Nostoc sp. MS1]